jgi:hypothetical protein
MLTKSNSFAGSVNDAMISVTFSEISKEPYDCVMWTLVHSVDDRCFGCSCSPKFSNYYGERSQK